jgi:putative cell wall-binding protein
VRVSRSAGTSLAGLLFGMAVAVAWTPAPSEKPDRVGLRGAYDGRTPAEEVGRVEDAVVERLAGGDRIATAVAISQATYQEATVVVLARADDFADALVAAPLAEAEGGPILLTPSDELDPSVAREIERLRPDEVLLLGGEDALATEVEDAVAQGRPVTRLSGNDRYGTAAAVAGRLPAWLSAVVATGTSFPDALAAAPYAAASNRPILLVGPDFVPPATERVLDEVGAEEVVVVGGELVVTPAVAEALEARDRVVNRLGGPDRYRTAGVVHQASLAEGLDPNRVWLASGTSFPDALTAGPAAASLGESLLLVDGEDLEYHRPVIDQLRPRAADLERLVLLGGRHVMTEQAPEHLRLALTAPLLPSGGRRLFPDSRMVAYYGNAQSAALGVLGEGTPEEIIPRLMDAATPFDRPERPLLPAMELIVDVAQFRPGPDGDYSLASTDEHVQRYLDAARGIGAYLFLDIQPGRSTFLPAVQRWERFLKEPDVGLALDSEWRMGPNEVPGRVIGSVDAAEVNEVADYLAALVRDNDLPQKLFVVHQFTEDMITNRDQIIRPRELAFTIHIDGFGPRGAKLDTYGEYADDPNAFYGFKLFYDEDPNIFQPDEVLEVLDPVPDLITYQ